MKHTESTYLAAVIVEIPIPSPRKKIIFFVGLENCLLSLTFTRLSWALLNHLFSLISIVSSLN